MNKPGIKSTEFWLSMIGMIGGMLLSVFPENPYTKIAGILLSSISGGSYTLGRSYAKSKVESSIEGSRIVAETLLKKSS